MPGVCVRENFSPVMDQKAWKKNMQNMKEEKKKDAHKQKEIPPVRRKFRPRALKKRTGSKPPNRAENAALKERSAPETQPEEELDN